MNNAHAQSEDESSFNPPAPEDCNTGESEAQEDRPAPQDCHAGDIESEEDPANEESALETRKSEFNGEVNKRMAAISQDQRAKHIMSDDQFNNIMNVLLSVRTATPEKRLYLMRSYPNKVAYK